MEVSQAEFARMAGVSAMAISKQVKNKLLVLNSAGRLDTDNPANRAYLDAHRQKIRENIALKNVAASAKHETSNVRSAGKSNRVHDEQKRAAWKNINEEYAFQSLKTTPHDLLSLPVGELVRKYDSVDGVEKYVKILRDLTTADEKSQRMQERRSVLIPREFVMQKLFGFLSSLSNRLLDIPESVSDQTLAVVKASENPRRAVIDLLSDTISRAIEGAKEQLEKELIAFEKGGSIQSQNETLIQELTEKIERLEENGGIE